MLFFLLSFFKHYGCEFNLFHIVCMYWCKNVDRALERLIRIDGSLQMKGFTEPRSIC
jgi:hypothetical protein